MSPDLFREFNGYDNRVWGGGGEDVEFYNRIRKAARLPIIQPAPKSTLFDMLSHGKLSEPDNQPNPKRFRLIKGYKQGSASKNGLEQLDYTRKELRYCGIYTHLMVDLNAPK